MKIKFSKKILHICLIFLFAGLFLIGYVFWIRDYNNDYNKLFEFCDEKIVDNEATKECKVFIEDSYKKNNKECFVLILPAIEPSERNVEVCFKQSKLKWENLYGDYSSNIPVEIKMTYKNIKIIPYKFEDVEIVILSDQEAYDVVRDINKETSELIVFRTSEHEKLQRSGYDISEIPCEDFSETICNTLVVFKVLVEDFNIIEDDRIKLKIKLWLNGKELEKEIITDEILYQEFLYAKPKATRTEFVKTKFELDSILSRGQYYQGTFIMKEYPKFDEDLINSFLDKNIDFSLSLIGLVYYVEN